VQEDVQQNRYLLTLNFKHSIGFCPHCKNISDCIKQRRHMDGIADLPIGTHSVELIVRVGQYSCETCRKCFTPPIDFLAEGSHATERLLERASELIRNSDIASAARFFRVPEKNLERWYYDYVERVQRQTTETSKGKIEHIGIDEISLKKSTDNSSQ
jgi:transposase